MLLREKKMKKKTAKYTNIIKKHENELRVQSSYISYVNPIYYIFTPDYVTCEYIANGVHSVQYFSIIH